MSTTPTSPPEPFTVDRSGTEFLPLDRTEAPSWKALSEILAEIKGAGRKAVSRRAPVDEFELDPTKQFAFQVAAEVDFAEVWNRLVRQYTSPKPPIRGARMRGLVERVAGELAKGEG
jgi:hypothetical protein